MSSQSIRSMLNFKYIQHKNNLEDNITDSTNLDVLISYYIVSHCISSLIFVFLPLPYTEIKVTTPYRIRTFGERIAESCKVISLTSSASLVTVNPNEPSVFTASSKFFFISIIISSLAKSELKVSFLAC